MKISKEEWKEMGINYRLEIWAPLMVLKLLALLLLISFVITIVYLQG